VVFPAVHAEAESLLTVRLGVLQEAWTQPGDGAEFVVFVQGANDARSKLFAEYLDPKHVAADREWRERRIPLRAFQGQDVRLTLAVEGGPAGDTTADWGVWADPQIVLHTDR
jgi:hypothetical protein